MPLLQLHLLIWKFIPFISCFHEKITTSDRIYEYVWQREQAELCQKGNLRTSVQSVQFWSRDIYYICWCLEKLDVSDIRSPPNWAQSDTLIYRSPSSEKKKNLHCMAEPKWGSIWFHLLFQTCETLKRLSCSLSTLSMAYIYILPYFLGGT